MNKSITANTPPNNSGNSTPFSSRPPLSRFHVMRELAQRDLHEFVSEGWHVLEPGTPFVDGIHVRAICMHLQAIAEARLENLIINVPSGHAKSLLTAVFLPAWWWIHAPETRFLYASYSASISVRDSLSQREK